MLPSSSSSTSLSSTSTRRIQVRWFRPTWSTVTRAGSTPEQRRDPALEGDRDVAKPDRAMAGVEQRAGDDPDRIGEVDDPCVVGGELARALRDSQHDRHRPHRLREPAGAGRLLADAAARGRDRLVAQPRCLAADADLDQHRVGAVQRPVELPGQLERAGEALTVEDPSRQPADDLAPVGVDVVQHEFAHVDPLALEHQPGDELRRVGRSGADHREFHLELPPSPDPVIP